jgi:hypothetical protein
MALAASDKASAIESKLHFDNTVSAVDEAGSESSAGYDDKATRRLLRKVDFALIPFLALLYL